MTKPARQFFWCTVIAASLLGCEKEEPIVQHRIPKAKPLPASELAVYSKKQRILGVIVPDKDHTWFFKLMGPEATVKAESENFNKLLESVKLAGNEFSPIQFTPPKTWKSQGASQMAMISYGMGSGDLAAKFTVTKLEGPAGGVLENINRWRHTQLGLPPITEAELSNVTSPVVIDGHKGIMADFTGSGSGGGAPMSPMGGPMAGDSSAAPPAAAPAGPGARGNAPKFVMPESWKPDAGTSMSIAAFAAGDAKVTLTPIAGDGGGVLSNVNRWRGQVGLQPLDQAAFDKEKAALMVDGSPAVYVDLPGPTNRMLGVILQREGHAWFVKMLGPVATVGSQKAAFETFVTSLQFENSPGSGK